LVLKKEIDAMRGSFVPYREDLPKLNKILKRLQTLIPEGVQAAFHL